MNLISNSSFETDLSGWGLQNGSGTAVDSVDATQAGFGAKALKLVCGSAGADDCETYWATVTPGETYTLSAYVYVESFVAAAAASRGLYMQSGGGALEVSTPIDGSTPVGEWVRLSITGVIPSGQTLLQLRLYAPKGTVYWDGVKLEVGAAATDYTDDTPTGVLPPPDPDPDPVPEVVRPYNPFPANNRYPSETAAPASVAPYVSSIPSDDLFPSLSFFPSSTQTRVIITLGRDDRDTVGPPRPGNNPRPKLLPGAHDDIPKTYQRVHYPGEEVYPSRSLYPYNDAPHLPTSYVGAVAVFRQRLRLAPQALGAALWGTARFLLDLNFNVIGVLASDSDRKMRTVVELGTFSEGAELTDFSGSAEFESFATPVELS